MLAKHNEYRSIHKVPPLKYNESMNEYAQEWADQIASTGNFRHRPNNKYGENIAMHSNDC